MFDEVDDIDLELKHFGLHMIFDAIDSRNS